jgi:ubiquitin thioesterase OTU1
MNYDNRIYVIYDGIHYDALAQNVSEEAPEANDTTIFNKNDEVAYNGALFVANQLREAR